MRRLGSLAIAMAMTILMVGSADAAPRSTFTGDFDTMVDGQVIGHISAKLWSTQPAFAGPAGTYSSAAPGFGVSNAQVGTTSFFHHPEWGYDEVWFKAVEIGYPGDGTDPGYAMFVGHFVDMLDASEADWVEFYGQTLLAEPTPSGGPMSLGDPYYFRFDVGEGAFSLHVAG